MVLHVREVLDETIDNRHQMISTIEKIICFNVPFEYSVELVL